MNETLTWRGSNGSFDNPLNWTPTGVPGFDIFAVIRSGIVHAGDENIGAIIMDIKGTVTRSDGLDEVGNPFPPGEGGILDGRGGGNLQINLAANSTYVMNTSMSVGSNGIVSINGQHGGSSFVNNYNKGYGIISDSGGSMIFDTKVSGDGYLTVDAVE
jgi:hypothetical protein